MNIHVIRTAGRLTAALFLAAVLSASYLAAQDPQAPPPAGKTPPAKMLPRDALGLTPEQEKALEEFRKTRMEESRAFRDEMSKIREEMRGLAKDPTANEKKINSLIDKRAKLQADRYKAGFKNRAARAKIFTPEQLERMKAFGAGFEGRPGFAGRGRMGMGPMRYPDAGMGRHRGPGYGFRPMYRYRSFRRCPFYRWRW